MRILFIYPNLHAPYGINSGLASIAGVLKANGHDCKLIQIHEILKETISKNYIENFVEEFAPNLIGFSVMTQQYSNAKEIAISIKKRFNIPIVIGGIHCTMQSSNLLLKDNIWDYICVGEGEFAMLDLVNQFKTGIEKDIPNIINCRDNLPSLKSVRPLLNLRETPNRDFEIFNLNMFLKCNDGWMRVMTSRGCPNSCSYCQNYSLYNRYKNVKAVDSKKDYLRFHSVEKIILELKALKFLHPEIEVFNFDDDLFTYDKERTRKFTDLYKESGLCIPYVINSHVNYFDYEIATYLKNSGCKMVRFGVESGSDYIRNKILNRKVSKTDIITAFDICNQIGLHSSAFLMIGIPFESRAHLFETIKLCAQVKMGRFRWSYLYPYPGTLIYKIADKQGIINKRKAFELNNYFDDSCFIFGDEHDLFLNKIGKVFNWYVNAYCEWEVSEVYRDLVSSIDKMSKSEWESFKIRTNDIDRELSEKFIKQGKIHYSKRFSNNTGVHSKYANSGRVAQLLDQNYFDSKDLTVA